MSESVAVWPRRTLSPSDRAGLTCAGAATYLERQRGSLNGWHDPAAPLPKEGALDSPSQIRDREAARVMRVTLGAEAFQGIVTAYADEIRLNLEADNKARDKEAI